MSSIFDKIMELANFICGVPLFIAASTVSVILIFSTRGFAFRYLGHFFQENFGRKSRRKQNSGKGISSFSACCTALGNTLGVGNIAGISIALASGGPGALFWIWIAGLLGVAIKYSEVVLGCRYRSMDAKHGIYRGGIMWYIEQGMGHKWKWLAVTFALLYGTTGFLLPAMQINSIVGAFEGVLVFPPVIIGIISAVLIAFVLLGGIRRLSDLAEKVIPFAAALYLVVSLLILICNATNIPAVLKEVFVSAFAGSAAKGGFAGATAVLALRYGIMRGFYSNGAATGDAAFAHSVADVEHPVQQGMWGAAEVCIDTIVCSSTALVVLCTGVLDTGLTGTALTTAAFSSFFHSEWMGAMFIGIIIIFFAFTTAVVSAYYGEVCVHYLIKSEKRCGSVVFVYRLFMCISAAIGSVTALELLWTFCDFALAFCMFICMCALMVCRKEVVALTKEYVSKYAKKV